MSQNTSRTLRPVCSDDTHQLALTMATSEAKVPHVATCLLAILPQSTANQLLSLCGPTIRVQYFVPQTLPIIRCACGIHSRGEALRRILFAIVVCAVSVSAQEFRTPTNPGTTPTAAPIEKRVVEQNLVAAEPGALVSQERIPSGARVYVAPMANGFDNYIVAGLQQKKVPVIVLADRNKADYEVSGVAETDKAGWAKMMFLGSQQTNETASVKMVNLKTGTVIFAYSVNKSNSVRGKQSAGEACAKHIREKIIQ